MLNVKHQVLIFNLEIWSFVLIILLFPNFVFATDFSSASFDVKNPVMDAGGITGASSASFKNTSALRQAAIATSSSSSFQLQSGFLYFSAAAVAAAPAAAPSLGSAQNGGILSEYLNILVQAVVKPVKALKPCNLIFDLNCDGSVDIKDLSIFLNQAPGALANKTDFSKNLSILLHSWTSPLAFFPSQPSGLPTLPKQLRLKSPPSFFNEKIAAISLPKKITETVTGLTQKIAKSVQVSNFIKKAADFIFRIFGKVAEFLGR